MPASNFVGVQETANSPSVRGGCVAGLRKKIIDNILPVSPGGIFGANSAYKKVMVMAADAMLFPERYTPIFAAEIMRTVDVNFFDDTNNYDPSTFASNITDQTIRDIAGVNASDT